MSPGVKVHQGLEYFDGNHPEIRRQYRAGRRPTEFGNRVWATSLVLMDHIENHIHPAPGLRVLEVGCGWGLVGLYLAKRHLCDVTCSDIDPHALPIVDLHAQHNQVQVATVAKGFADMTPDFLQDFDLIVGAEVCYSADVAEALFAMVKRAFASGVGQVLLADPGRPDFEEGAQRCDEYCTSKRTVRPGSVNGKTTLILSATPR